MPIIPQTPPPTDNTVSFDLTCAGCNYNLKTLIWESTCPECGMAVRCSTPLPGFRFPSRRVADRTSGGLILIVCMVILANLNSFGFILYARYLHVVYEWGIATIVSRSSLILGSVILLFDFAGIVLIAYPFGRSAHYRRPFLGYVTVMLAVVHPLTEALGLFILFVWGVNTWVTWIQKFDLVLPIAILCSSVSVVLLWIILVSRIERTTNRRLRFFGCLSIVAAFLTGLDDLLIGLLIPYIRWFDDIEFINIYDMGEWWSRYVDTACWIVILIAIGGFLRRLKIAILAASAPPWVIKTTNPQPRKNDTTQP